MQPRTPPPAATPEVRQRFLEALDALVERLKQDRMVIAAILAGSLSHDQVWAKSDIDLIILVRDDAKKTGGYSLVENGVHICASVMTRRKFKEALERSLQSDFFHSVVAHSRLLFSTDETLKDYYDNIRHVGARDRDLHLLNAGAAVLALLAKAEKWLYIRKDPHYSLVWTLYCVERIATIEVVLAGEVPGREVIHQALRHNPALFGALYTDLIRSGGEESTVRDVLQAINDYLDARAYLLFRPILEYLAGEGGFRTSTDLEAYFSKQTQCESLSFAYEWLSEKGILRKVSFPIRLTPKSSATVEEAAFYYDGAEGAADSPREDVSAAPDGPISSPPTETGAKAGALAAAREVNPL